MSGISTFSMASDGSTVHNAWKHVVKDERNAGIMAFFVVKHEAFPQISRKPIVAYDKMSNAPVIHRKYD
jgi:hypothetical protein